ncbi:uncharacterized protein K452DRAFT_235208 [Aplosporella prunicola CBS 121167]|uniref:Methyltransferase domain-containing protein n=1 Tax=Aplosporella prunicola CBS 121167 TaxID=1176127 RepID=A0A6A6B3K2_9PEZI|nr:uncharacterized protein K452DRAFT_235208 [Aplosporella prunicola CBS 121167]KAF2137943.1 hypothetical protein K452DRAFT_235208 [Aplosporella prunicola CBS 121167]
MSTARAPRIHQVYVEIDPGHDDDDMYSYETWLSSTAERYRVENGRRFHAYRDGVYNFPNDDREQDRLDMVHQMSSLAIGDALFCAPMKKDPKRILDIGTGTGIWAIEAADRYPEAEVIGNDLSPIQPRWVPPNVHFEVDDVESEWPERPPFDFIHARYLAGSIADWPLLMQRCYEAVAPGGWVEFGDYEMRYVSDDGTLTPDNHMKRLAELLNEGCDAIGRTCSPGPKLEHWMRDAGFVDIGVKVCKLPMGHWAKDPDYKAIGFFNLMQTTDGLEAFVLGIFTRVLGWKPFEVQVFLAKARADLKRKDVHMYLHYWKVWGRRPEMDKARNEEKPLKIVDLCL